MINAGAAPNKLDNGVAPDKLNDGAAPNNFNAGVAPDEIDDGAAPNKFNEGVAPTKLKRKKGSTQKIDREGIKRIGKNSAHRICLKCHFQGVGT